MFFQNPVAWQKAHLILVNGLVFLKIPSKLNCCQRGFQDTPHFTLGKGPAAKWDEFWKNSKRPLTPPSFLESYVANLL